jgi:peptidyl-prolyl cis-trans isomerase D
VFGLDAGQARVIEEGDFVAVIQLDRITPAATAGDEADALRQAIAAQAEQGIAQDAFAAFSTALSAKAGITIDEAAVAAVQAQFN